MADGEDSGGASLDLTALNRNLSSASTLRRITQLESLAEELKYRECSEADIATIIRELFNTHARYRDRRSRYTVAACLKILLNNPLAPHDFSPFVDRLRDEGLKAGIASSSAFVLVEWCAALLEEASTSIDLWDRWAPDLIVADAQLLEICARPGVKRSLKRAALAATCRALRRSCTADEAISRTLKDSLTKLTTADKAHPPLRNAVFLGMVARACVGLPAAELALGDLKSQLYAFYVREILGSRTPVPNHVAECFGDFFGSFATEQDLEQHILPAVEKAMLRAPEIVLEGVIPALLRSIPPEIDLSKMLQAHLLKPLLSNLKSTDATVRNAALAVFEIAVGRSSDEAILDDIGEELLLPFKSAKAASPDQRLLHARMLAALRPSEHLCGTVLSQLCPGAAKESNEASLDAESAAIAIHLRHALVNKAAIEPTAIDVLVRGLGDKRPAIRRTWTLRAGELVWTLGPSEMESPEVLRFIDACTPALYKIWNEVAPNPLQAISGGLVAAAYVIIAVYHSRLATLARDGLLKNDMPGVAAVGSPAESRPVFLLNHRVYTKNVSRDDVSWFLQALVAISDNVFELADAELLQDSLAEAFTYLVCSSVLKSVIRRRARQALSEVYAKHPVNVANAVLRTLRRWQRHSEHAEEGAVVSATKNGTDDVHVLVHCICLSSDKLTALGGRRGLEALEEQLVDMCIICRSEVFPRTSWIGACQLMGFDPGEVARKHSQKLLQKILDAAQEGSRDSPMLRNAAFAAAAELAFVAPDVFTEIIVGQMAQDLDSSRLHGVGPTEAAIFRTPEGTAFVDVLASKEQTTSPSNIKDGDILKWEADLRAQLAQKRGEQRKLTAAERAKVDAQLEKEAVIRNQLKEAVVQLQRGYGLIHGLAWGPPTQAEAWLWPSLTCILSTIRHESCLLTGQAPSEAYLACSEKVTTRLGTLRRFIGAATLRSLPTAQLPNELTEEPLGDQVSRVLYRLRLASEQRPFDVVSLLYILPLLLAALSQEGIGKSQGEDADVQVILCLEILALHVEICGNQLVPRKEIISVLVSSMQRHSSHYKVLRECIFGICRSVAVNISPAEVKALLQGAIVPERSVRATVLQAIDEELELTDFDFLEEIWLACHDDVDENAELAHTIWAANKFRISDDSAASLLAYIGGSDEQLRRSAASAIAAAVELNPSSFDGVNSKLRSIYYENSKLSAAPSDPYGRQKKQNLDDNWEARSGVALTYREMSSLFPAPDLVPLIRFLIDEGPLRDPSAVVRQQMIDSAKAVIAASGHSRVEELMQTFEGSLEECKGDIRSQDLVKEAIIILFGALARHLKAEDHRLPKVLRRLLEALDTPSEAIQYAVAECLPPLVRTSTEPLSGYIEETLQKLLESKSYAARRGAAYGLAGMVLGKGISTLREYRIMSKLQTAIEDKKNPHHRQGALLAYELLTLFLGRMFEPYTIKIVPQLLASFGDSDNDVRDSCLDAAKTCFSRLSSYGVKQILPPLLDGLDDPQWRSKKGACDLLGAMAYLDPEQLAQSLPEIIPPLTNVLNDSHKEVRAAAKRSLQRFGDVISNPEMRGVVGVLLKAISDPIKYTDDALDALIKISFVHYLDAPSLALVVRIVERGLGDRSATKRKSAQIIGSLAHLTERKDLIVHLRGLVGGLRVAIHDPVPTTRATASKALGSLIERLGEESLPDLIPSLMATLKSETGAGDRLGSAQALSEVLAGLGASRLEETLPTILQNASSTQPTVREGFMTLFIFLPACFGNSFAAYLSKIIPPILTGLADEVDSIRETALRAGRLLVRSYATRAVDLLLPELERGLADDNHRIRLSSVELVGDLLFTLTGKTGNVEHEEAEEDVADAGQSLGEVLGEEKRARVLSLLYICRCDTSALVRNAAISVWKVMVASPRVLKELVPTLTQLLIRRLASSNKEHKLIAGNALGELIRKAGERLMLTLLPMLEEGLHSSADSDAKQGVCIALRELTTSAAPETLQEYEKTLISIVRAALVDDHEEVRESAAEAFDSLQRVLGKRAVDQILPYLLSLLRVPNEAGNALSALLTLLGDSGRSSLILPNLLPTLLTPPISAFNAKALAALSQVAGQALVRRLPQILNGILETSASCKDDQLRHELDDSFDAILLSIRGVDGLNTAMSTMLALAKHEDHRRRAAADYHLAKFFADTDVDFSRYHQDLIRVLLISFDDYDPEVVKAAWTALAALTAGLKKELMEVLVIPTRQVLQGVGVPGVNLPGFCLPKGINAILPIFLQGLINGTADQRTQAALAISDIIDRTSPEALRPFVTYITGPLIRVVSERSTDVRVAILQTLNNLLEKIPTFLKPFLPQLQRTFAKSLADASSEVLRARAAKALGTLIPLIPRVDPLISELVTGSKSGDAGVKNAMLKALYEVVSKAGKSMSDASRTSIFTLSESGFNDPDDDILAAKARLLGALIKYLPDADAKTVVKSRVLTAQPTKASILCLNAVLLESSASITEKYTLDITTVIHNGLSGKGSFVSDNSVLAAGKFLLTDTGSRTFEITKSVVEGLARVIPPENAADTRRLALVVVRLVSRLRPELVRPHLSLLSPPIFASVRDPIVPVKLSAEAAFLALFAVHESEGAVFEKYMAGAGADLPGHVKRSMQEYFKRVAPRASSQISRNQQAMQAGEILSTDEKEDEHEIWSVGKVELGYFGDD